MENNVFYRKYRPTKFNDLVGHENVTNLLKQQIKENKIGHAFLFSGQKGTGKTSCARILAKSINCKNLKDFEPCNNCESCLMIIKNSSPDIFEIDAASNNNVEQIRDIKENVSNMPINSKYKVYIIDEVHMLTKSAFNALLKTLEEPPFFVVFILATTEYNKIPSTIVSRCQNFNFNKIKLNDMTKRLEEIALNENIKVSNNVLDEIYYLSDGSLRDALNYLQQSSMISEDKKIDINKFKIFFNISTKQEKIDLIKSIIKNDNKNIIKIFENYRNNGLEFNSFTLSILDIIKEIIEFKIIKEDYVLKVLNFEEVSFFEEINLNILFKIADNIANAYSQTKGTIIDFNYLLINLLKINNFEENQIINVEKEIKSSIKKIETPKNKILEKKETKKPKTETKKSLISNEGKISIKTLNDIMSKQISEGKKTEGITPYNVNIDHILNLLSNSSLDHRKKIQEKIEEIFKNENRILEDNIKAEKFYPFFNSKVVCANEQRILLSVDDFYHKNTIDFWMTNEKNRKDIFNYLEKEFIIYVLDKNRLEDLKEKFKSFRKDNIELKLEDLKVEEYYSNISKINMNKKEVDFINKVKDKTGINEFEIED